MLSKMDEEKFFPAVMGKTILSIFDVTFSRPGLRAYSSLLTHHPSLFSVHNWRIMFTSNLDIVYDVLCTFWDEDLSMLCAQSCI